MDEKSILKKIIEQEGSCEWANKVPNVCQKCPLGKLSTKLNGDYYSCVEALGAMDMSDKDADKVYKDAAGRVLANLEVESILLDDEKDN